MAFLELRPCIGHPLAIRRGGQNVERFFKSKIAGNHFTKTIVKRCWITSSK
jgi:hypothetical protein